MYDTVIFDLDGTLSDNSEGIIASIGYALDRMGREKPRFGWFGYASMIFCAAIS